MGSSGFGGCTTGSLGLDGCVTETPFGGWVMGLSVTKSMWKEWKKLKCHCWQSPPAMTHGVSGEGGWNVADLYKHIHTRSSRCTTVDLDWTLFDCCCFNHGWEKGLCRPSKRPWYLQEHWFGGDGDESDGRTVRKEEKEMLQCGGSVIILSTWCI